MVSVRNNLTLYERHASEWWIPDSPFFCSLHAVNQLCRDDILLEMGHELRDATVVDLGCGGGLLAKPLAERGAMVLASDLSGRSLCEARRQSCGVAVHPVQADACCQPFGDGIADLVLCADILEHIPAWPRVMAEASRLVRPGGRIFISTLTRTWLSSLIGVHLAEGLGFVPKGTHDPALLIRPDEIAACADSLGLSARPPVGLTPRLLKSVIHGRLHLRRSTHVLVSYALWLDKPPR